MPKIGILITVGRQYNDRFPEVVETIRAAGVDIDRASQLSAIVVGTAERPAIDAVSKIPEVIAVEEERQVKAV